MIVLTVILALPFVGGEGRFPPPPAVPTPPPKANYFDETHWHKAPAPMAREAEARREDIMDYYGKGGGGKKGGYYGEYYGKGGGGKKGGYYGDYYGKRGGGKKGDYYGDYYGKGGGGKKGGYYSDYDTDYYDFEGDYYYGGGGKKGGPPPPTNPPTNHPQTECEEMGSTCDMFVACGATGSCMSPICLSLASGGGACFEGTSACAQLTPCPNGDSDCPTDTVCAVGTCCSGKPDVCMPDPAIENCETRRARRLFGEVMQRKSIGDKSEDLAYENTVGGLLEDVQ